MKTDNATAVLVAKTTPGAEIAARLGLRPQRPLVVVMGGAAKLAPDDRARLERHIHEGLAPAMLRTGAAVIDGGTDSGIMGMLNAALAGLGFPGPYVGVAPAGVTSLPGEHDEHAYPFGGHHTHIVQVEGQAFGEERRPLFALAEFLSAGQRSLGVLANGGSGAEKEVLENVRQGREVVLLRGSGRLADELAEAIDTPHQARPAIHQMAALGRLTPFDLRNPPLFLQEFLLRKLGA
ncbi:MAG: hypothetical protein HYZ26_14680 [Chloroflexi bacterium]|nr:hypothetical protein [Chloroflexota bacterium]